MNRGKIGWILLITIACGMLVAAICVIVFGTKKIERDKGHVSPYVEIESIEEAELIVSKMRGPYRAYILECDGDICTITLYTDRDYEDSDVEPECVVTVDAEEVIDKLNELKVTTWDGFDGENPKGKKDGTISSFDLVYNDGEEMSMSGTNNFPENYSSLTGWFANQCR